MPNSNLYAVIHKKVGKLATLLFTLTLLCSLSGLASADIIDDIRMRTDANGEVDAQIRFTVPIHYVRHFPQQKAEIVSIHFTILGDVPPDPWQDFETHKLPSSDAMPGFSVTARELNSVPRIDIQFPQPTEFKVYVGKDGRSLILHIKPEIPLQQKNESRPEAGKPTGASVITAPVAITAATVVAATTPLPKPSGTAPTQPTAAPTTAAPTATAPTATAPTATAPTATAPTATAPTATAPTATAPTTTVPTQPATALPSQSMASVASAPVAPKTNDPRLGRKDGLPFFPLVEPVPQSTTAPQANETISLPELLKKNNNQAAIGMAKGRDAMLGGDLVVAMTAFDDVLKLPPNNYSEDAQVWLGISRERSGRLSNAISEYQTYLKLYPNGTSVAWVNDRLAKLKAVQPALFASATAPMAAQARPQQSTEFQTTEYGSLSMYYYHGASKTDTVATVANIATPTTLSRTDQSALISNVSMTARSYNNKFDNRLVFQDFFADNLLPGQKSKNRLNAAFFEVRNRVDNYSARIGRQSAMGGGVLGRFDGITAGYGFMPDWRANVVTGQLSDATNGPKPTFFGGSLDFGINSPLGGSVYLISQTVGGLVDRRAVGGNMRYFDSKATIMTMLDYDVQFKELNMLTIQGTLNGDSGTSYNCLLDRRKTPSLSVRNAINGTPATIDTLIQNGWTKSDLILLAKQRTAVSEVAQLGVTNRLDEKWQIGSDIVVSRTSGLIESGTQFIDPLTGAVTTGLDGYVPGTPASGNTWTLSERLIGNGIISKNGLSMYSVSYTKSRLMTGKSLLVNNRAYIQEQSTVDGMLRFYWQNDNFGGKQNTISPSFRYGYKLRTNLTVETEWGLDWTTATPSAMQSSKTTRKYSSLGFRFDF